MKKILQSIAILALLLSGQAHATQTTASASHWWGGSCSITCTDPTVAACAAGYWGCACACETYGGHSVIRQINPLTGQQLIDETALLNFTAGGSMQVFHDAIQNVDAAGASGDMTKYNSAEDAWVNAYSSLSSADKASLNTWLVGHGYAPFNLGGPN